MNKTTYRIATASLILLVGACGRGKEHEFETRSQEIITEPAMEKVKMEVPTQDTFRVEREVKTKVGVDTTRVRDGIHNLETTPRRPEAQGTPSTPNY